MNVSQFAFKYKISNIDKNVIAKLYGSEEKEESDWINILTGKVNFIAPEKVVEVKESPKIEIDAVKQKKIDEIKKKNESKK